MACDAVFLVVTGNTVPMSTSIPSRFAECGSYGAPLVESPPAVADATARSGATAEQADLPSRRLVVTSVGSATLNAGSVLVSRLVVEED